MSTFLKLHNKDTKNFKEEIYVNADRFEMIRTEDTGETLINLSNGWAYVSETPEEILDMIKEAEEKTIDIEAMQKQIPKKAIAIIGTEQDDFDVLYTCPECHYVLPPLNTGHKCVMEAYCGNCGQKLEWSEDDDSIEQLEIKREGNLEILVKEEK